MPKRLSFVVAPTDMVAALLKSWNCELASWSVVLLARVSSLARVLKDGHCCCVRSDTTPVVDSRDRCADGEEPYVLRGIDWLICE